MLNTPGVTGTYNKVVLSDKPAAILSLNPEFFAPLIKSNISCHVNKTINSDLIDEITQQIIDSINFSLNKRDN